MTERENGGSGTPRLSRRQVLAGLGVVGVASAGTGLGTTAFFADREELEGWLDAGRVDLLLDYRSTYQPWDRYELKGETPPALVADTTMTYEIAAAPAVRHVDTGEALSHQEWADLVTGNTDAFGDVCTLADPTDISDLLPEGFETLRSGTAEAPGVYHPGFIDGPRGMFVDLVDVKPYDEGETTFSLHVCGNPAFVFAELLREDSEGQPLPRSDEHVLVEPESAAGDTTLDLGELCDYLYVVVSTDPDCDNLAPAADDSGDTNPLGVEGEDGHVLYAGSMTGWLEQFGPTGDGRLVIPPVFPVNDTSKQSCFTPGVHCYVMNWYLPCKEFDGASRLGFTDLPVKNALVEGQVVTDQDGDAAITFNDELRQRGYVVDGLDATESVNVTQTDSCHVGMRFVAEQCRHNMEWEEDGTADPEVSQEPGTTTEGGQDGGGTGTGDGTTTQEPGTTTGEPGTTTGEPGTTTSDPGTTTTNPGTTTTTDPGTTTTNSGTTTTTTNPGTTTTTTNPGTTTTTTNPGTTKPTTRSVRRLGAPEPTTTVTPGTTTGPGTTMNTGGTTTAGAGGSVGGGTAGGGTTTAGGAGTTTTAAGAGGGAATTGGSNAAAGGVTWTSNPLKFAGSQLSSPAGLLLGGLAGTVAAIVGLWRKYHEDDESV
ncbi:hypothetical protein [Haloarchaeobius amylolyticus]|uniref:hypothetical protein n=1 Tax=Haloarchaeobius amylolyticus TaxID=1198296 RepID=UPI00226E000B|nr:hypothetical protein [Haloarchaeobius amylolyticus]